MKLIKLKKLENISFQNQITVIFCLIMVFVSFFYIALSEIVMEYFYIKEKDRNIVNLVEYASLNSNNLNDLSVINNMERTCKVQNVSLVLFSKENRKPFMFLYNKDSSENLEGKLNDYISKKENKTLISNVYYDEYLNLRFREIIGEKNKFYYYSKTPIDTMKESARVSSLFIISSMVIVLPISFFVIYLFSKKINGPIKSLADYTNSVSEMNFDSKFNPGGSKEIYDLGKDVIKMANALECNIKQLKLNNETLQKDLTSREELEKMRLEYLSQISHELKTPIAIILGYSEMLTETDGDYPSIINKEARKMELMVKDILSSDLSSYKGFLKIEEVNIYNLINNLVVPTKSIYLNKNIRLNMFIPQDVSVNTNKALLSQILSNFIVNALEFSSGVVNIYIEKELESEFICVYNSGDNISEEESSKIWNKFYTSGKNRKIGGDGLGLNIAKESAEILNKKIGFKNEKDGVVFYIELWQEGG